MNEKSRLGNKKLSLLLVLKALEQMSDEQHPIPQITLSKMVNDISGKYDLDIWCDRKTVGRHIALLTAAGYPIVKVKGKGCYLSGSSKFTKGECRALLALIKNSDLPATAKKQLAKKLIAQQQNIDGQLLRSYLDKDKGDQIPE